MNIVNKLTIRHLRKNKRRTLVTIIGVIISVAMLTAVATIGVSFMDLMKRQTIADEGEWHVVYKDVDIDQVHTIKKDEDTKKVVLSKDLGYALLKGSKNENKPYLFIKEYNQYGFEQFPIELSSGRLPQSENEIVISDEIINNAKVDYRIGDIITLDVGNRIANDPEIHGPMDQTFSLMTNEKGEMNEELKDTSTKEFAIVGTIKRPTWEIPWAPGYTVISYLDEELLGKDDLVNATVVLNKVKTSLFNHATNLAEKNQIGKVDFNNNLLRYYGVIKSEGMRTTLYSLSAIIMVIIIIGSVSLIYNAFAISVAERSRHLGMLSSVGATKKQKQNSVFFEGFVIGLISIPIGIIAGLAGMGITFLFINTIIQGAMGVSEKLKVTLTPGSILVAVLVSIITIFISTFIPAIRASRISAIDAIRQSTDVKLTRKAVKTSKFVRKVFGIEAEIGLKNLKRNKRRYQATVFSLVISIMLFLSVAFFTANLKKSLSLSQEGQSFDIMMEVQKGRDDQLVKSILSMDEVTKSSMMSQQYFVSSWIEKDKTSDAVRKFEGFNDQLVDGKYPYGINLYSLDEKSLKAYAKEVGADYNELQNGLNAIVIDQIKYEDADAGKYVETKAIYTKVGEQIDLFSNDAEHEKEQFINKITVAALTSKLPMGANGGYPGSLDVIVSESTLEKLGFVAEDNRMLYFNSNDPLKTQEKIEEMEEVKHYIWNVYKSRQQEEQMVMIMSVFTYGFIVLITAISIANILNTISTSISLRKREFAMLKSVGMTPKGFNKMINYESIFYGVKALIYGLPLSVVCMLLIYKALANSFSYSFALPWLSIIYVIVAVFLIVGTSMLYSSAKVKKENIIDALKQESI
ncbi:ABC transporter permease [Lederbergia wuyishanensis]|uniref:ABC transport system permease protein n=1 Tax=Lederbergia wuyishanensis TaxID=1347903 RepID=A0ABU0D3N7_9BACI|nr:FtsX-like permease family protein [Lederbergia wuyishanensis]MCJ8007838.1 FtsX-like permease family protein [Lederbergia wuyishanensis]MDQ0342994.1 putative ABC transport system permease protein [Lederbergia wuyishanensis]